MKLVFLGTRGEIEGHSRRHRRHAPLLVEYHRRRVMIDCGRDWVGQALGIKPHAIILTHSHPDHAWGLKAGAPCPVYATRQTLEEIENYPIADRHTIEPRTPQTIGGMRFEAFAVEYSLRCPAVGYRVTASRVSIFYAPDLVYIHQSETALEGAALYVVDGATLEHSFVRKRGRRLIGNASVRTQLAWCEKIDGPEINVAHCGSQIVKGDERRNS